LDLLLEQVISLAWNAAENAVYAKLTFSACVAYTNNLPRHIIHEGRTSSSHSLAIFWTGLGNLSTTNTRRNNTTSILDHVRPNMIIRQPQFGSGSQNEANSILQCRAPSAELKPYTTDHVDHSCSSVTMLAEQATRSDPEPSTFHRHLPVNSSLPASFFLSWGQLQIFSTILLK
jgi:hypothetical protein